MAGQPKSCAKGSARPSRRRSRIISPRPVSTILRSSGGERRAIRRCAARRSRRRSPISARRSPWRTGRRQESGRVAGAAEDRNCTSHYGQRADRDARLRGTGNDGSFFCYSHAGSTAGQRGPRHLAADYGLWVGSHHSRRASARKRTRKPSSGTARRDSPIRRKPALPIAGNRTHVLVRRRVSRSARSSGTRASFVQPGARRRFGVPLRMGRGRGGDWLTLTFSLWPMGDVEAQFPSFERRTRRGPGRSYRHPRAIRMLSGFLRTDAWQPLARRLNACFELAESRESMSLTDLAGVRARFLRAGRRLNERGGRRGARGHAPRRRSCCANKTSGSSMGSIKIGLAEARGPRGRHRPRYRRSSTKALATATGPATARSTAELHRVRGDMLLKRNPATPRPPKKPSEPLSPSQAAGGAQLRTARGAFAGQALPIDRPARRRPRRPRPRARRLFADTRNARDRRGAGAADCTRSDRRGQSEAGAAAATDAIADVAYGNALLQARGYGAPETTEAFARARKSASGDKDAPGRLAADYGLWVGSYMRGDLPAMRAHAAAFLNDVEARPNSPEAERRPSRRRDHLLVRRRVRASAGSLGTGARLVPTRPRRRSGLPFRTGPRRRRDGLSCACVVASRRGRSRDFAHRPHADADRGPHPCRHARVWKNVRGHVRIDAGRPHARGAERLRARPARA